MVQVQRAQPNSTEATAPNHNERWAASPSAAKAGEAQDEEASAAITTQAAGARGA